jgi:integrase
MPGKKRTSGTGAVYQDRASGQWIGEAVIDGKRRRVKARTKVDASKRIVALINDAQNGAPAADGNARVAELLDLWRERVLPNRSLSPASLDGYDHALRMLKLEFGRVRLRTLDIDRIEAGLDRLATGTVGSSRGKPLSRRSLKLYRSTLAQVLDLGVRRKLISGNPARMAELTPTAARTRPRRSLTADEAEVLWAALEGQRLGNLFRLMLVTGLRPGEALGLAWDAVDLDAGLLHVRRAVRLERGRAVLVNEVKTSGSWRTIGLPAPAVAVLRAQRRAVAELKLAARVWATSDAELVFPTAQGTPWDLSNVRDELTRACAEAGVPRVTPHELRHSCASILNDRGVALELIADLLGHTDTTMLARTYRHRLRPSADAAVEVMGALFGAPEAR